MKTFIDDISKYKDGSFRWQAFFYKNKRTASREIKHALFEWKTDNLRTNSLSIIDSTIVE